MDTALTDALKRIERLITRPAESLDDPQERREEFQRRLERTRRLVAKLGNPHRRLNIIHIGGTSGKGSTAIMCESMLRALGLQTGTHTSPYLQTPLEKARVNGRLIASDEALALSEKVLEAAAAVQAEEPGLGNPHYAEAWLGLALRHFADQQCEAAVIEVGMGGRYDATNIVTPRVSVISTVHYDHTRVLGDDISDIAGHKAGIIKAGVPVIVGQVPTAAWSVITGEAIQRGSRIIRVSQDVNVRPIEITQTGSRFTYEGLHIRLEDVHVGMLGAHQIDNATAALAALEVYATSEGITLDEAALREGLAAARFAGRMELIQKDPLVVLDGAHNEEKIGALAAALPNVFDYDRVILVAGMLEAKAVEPIVQQLADVADVMVATSPKVKGKPAIPAEELARIARKVGMQQVTVAPEPLDALKHALDIARPGDIVVVTGSLYLIGQIRSHWHTTDEIIAQRTMFPNGIPA